MDGESFVLQAQLFPLSLSLSFLRKNKTESVQPCWQPWEAARRRSCTPSLMPPSTRRRAHNDNADTLANMFTRAVTVGPGRLQASPGHNTSFFFFCFIHNCRMTSTTFTDRINVCSFAGICRIMVLNVHLHANTTACICIFI